MNRNVIHNPPNRNELLVDHTYRNIATEILHQIGVPVTYRASLNASSKQRAQLRLGAHRRAVATIELILYKRGLIPTEAPDGDSPSDNGLVDVPDSDSVVSGVGGETLEEV